MYSLFSSSTVLWAVIAGVLFFLVAPHLALTSRPAALAARLAAAALLIDFGAVFFGRFLAELPLPVDPFLLINTLTRLAFWGCLAWAVLALLESAPKKEELR